MKQRLLRLCYLAALLLALPLLLTVALAIAVMDGRPVLFAQSRLGLGRRGFTVYKFRTMQGGVVTRTGRVLRATGLDELPQLWNMLRGDMALVGPRPLTLADVQRLGWESDAYALRWSVRPGLTGLAQLSPRCHRRFTWVYDRYYAMNAGLGLDACCILRSACVPFLGKSRARRWGEYWGIWR